ncbi:MAG: VWA domain-containing protein, partial [Pseudomonadota bacterium]
VPLDGLALADIAGAGPDADADVVVGPDAGPDDGRDHGAKAGPKRLPRARMEALDALTRLAAGFGIASLRAPLQALAVARALAAAEGARNVSESHLGDAVAISLIPRATRMPASEQDQPDEAPPEPPDPDDLNDDRQDDQDGDHDRDATEAEQGPLEDRILDAVKAILPELMLSARTGRQRGDGTAGAGARQKSALRGRPAGVEPGAPAGGRRLDLLATLRNAAPWQPVRRRTRDASDAASATGAPAGGILVEPDDFRLRRFERPAESVMVFAVDASGSAAAARMAEAKGAVEIMLSEAYRRREKVALIAFRGAAAHVILEPTRSLLQAKRQLSVLPGGGGTPLAAALVTAGALARQIRQRGATPFVVMLTDGRGNVALSGEPGRTQAAEDQGAAASAFAAEGVTTILIDTANRPQKDAADLARRMGARYLPLPRADARGISRAVRAATGT